MNSHLRTTYILIIIIVTAIDLLGQSIVPDKELARVGSKIISGQEFQERYEFTPGERKNDPQSNSSNKIDFLYTLIAEKLWALEAENIGLDTTEVIRFSKKEFEKMFIRDELYKREVTQKVIISEDELEGAYLRYLNKLKVNFLFSESGNEINDLFNLLDQGIPFDTLLSVRPEAEEQTEPIEVVFGQMEEAIEDSLYQLNVNEFTSPIFTPDGWYIFKIANRSSQLLSSGGDVKTTYSNAKKIIQARKEIKLFQEFYVKFFNQDKINVNPVLFESLARNLSHQLKLKKRKDNNADDKPIHILADDVVQIESRLGGDTLSMKFINFPENPINLKDYFRSLVFNGFSAEEFSIESIRKLLDKKTKNFIEQELLYREGLNRGYLTLPSVQNDIQMWNDNYLFQMLKNKFQDSTIVSENEIYDYYKKNHSEETYPALVNIVEILTSQPEIADTILKEIKNGSNFDSLAKKYNERAWTKKSNGKYGLFPVYDHGEIGKIASGMKIGEVFGPIKLEEGYSIIKLIDRKEEEKNQPLPFEELKEKYRRQLSFEKLKRKMNDYTVSLALKYGVAIDLNLLDKIEVTSIPAFAIRRLGFGGQVTAVPLLAPNSEWVNEWIQKQHKVP